MGEQLKYRSSCGSSSSKESTSTTAEQTLPSCAVSSRAEAVPVFSRPAAMGQPQVQTASVASAP